MKKLLIFLMALVTLAVTTPTFAAKRSIMELPLFERAVLIIKKFENVAQAEALALCWLRASSPAGRTLPPRLSAHRSTGRRTAPQRPRQVLRTLLPIRQRLSSSRRTRLQLWTWCRQQIHRPEKTESRRPQHLQILHLPLPLQRQVAQRSLHP